MLIMKGEFKRRDRTLPLPMLGRTACGERAMMPVRASRALRCLCFHDDTSDCTYVRASSFPGDQPSATLRQERWKHRNISLSVL